MSTDYDSPWKEALDAYFEPFVAMLFPETHRQIDWTRNLYQRSFSPKDVRALFRLIGWLMELPPALAVVFRQDLDKIEEEKRMPYITSIERLARSEGQRVGQREGLQQGIETFLRFRFGDEGLKLMPEIREIHEEEKLEAILKALETAVTLDEVRQRWSPGAT